MPETSTSAAADDGLVQAGERNHHTGSVVHYAGRAVTMALGHKGRGMAVDCYSSL